MALGENSYDILLERGLLGRAGELLDLGRKVLIVTDTGVPERYAGLLAGQCGAPVVARVEQGEGAKSFAVLKELLGTMLRENFSRADCVVALGGGVMGDLAGFAAACYMRGVDFYNIPTTALAQIDSSIGGKVAINFEGVKNVVGAFYQPRRVLIDPALLDTLPPRQFANGMAEALKAGMVGDEPLLALLERGGTRDHLEEILLRSLRFKQRIVELDEKESGPRKLLNFGHTIGHGIESVYGLGGLLHGECVALGMLPMCTSPALRARLEAALQKNGLPTRAAFDPAAVYAELCHDKKAAAGRVTIVTAARAGAAQLETVPLEHLRALLEREAKEGIGA